MTQINLLPWREQARREKKNQFALAVLACVAAAGVFVGILHLYFNGLIYWQEQRNAYVQSTSDQIGGILMGLNKKKKAQTELEKQLKYVYSLQQESYQVVQILDALPRMVPDGVVFNRVSRKDAVITILGQAKSNLEITLLMKNLDISPVFRQPVLTEINAKETSAGEERYFKLEVEQEK